MLGLSEQDIVYAQKIEQLKVGLTNEALAVLYRYRHANQGTELETMFSIHRLLRSDFYTQNSPEAARFLDEVLKLRQEHKEGAINVDALRNRLFEMCDLMLEKYYAVIHAEEGPTREKIIQRALGIDAVRETSSE